MPPNSSETGVGSTLEEVKNEPVVGVDMRGLQNPPEVANKPFDEDLQNLPIPDAAKAAVQRERDAKKAAETSNPQGIENDRKLTEIDHLIQGQDEDEDGYVPSRMAANPITPEVSNGANPNGSNQGGLEGTQPYNPQSPEGNGVNGNGKVDGSRPTVEPHVSVAEPGAEKKNPLDASSKETGKSAEDSETKEKVTKLEDRMEKTEVKVTELDERVKKLEGDKSKQEQAEDRETKLRQELESLRGDMNKALERQAKLEEQVAKLNETLQKLTEAITKLAESRANNAVATTETPVKEPEGDKTTPAEAPKPDTPEGQTPAPEPTEEDPTESEEEDTDDENQEETTEIPVPEPDSSDKEEDTSEPTEESPTADGETPPTPEPDQPSSPERQLTPEQQAQRQQTEALLNRAREDMIRAEQRSRSLVRNILGRIDRFLGGDTTPDQDYQRLLTDYRNARTEWARLEATLSMAPQDTAALEGLPPEERQRIEQQRTTEFIANYVQQINSEDQRLNQESIQVYQDRRINQMLGAIYRNPMARLAIGTALNVGIATSVATGAVPLTAALVGARVAFGAVGIEGAMHRVQDMASESRWGARRSFATERTDEQLQNGTEPAEIQGMGRDEASRRLASFVEDRIRTRNTNITETEQLLRNRYFSEVRHLITDQINQSEELRNATQPQQVAELLRRALQGNDNLLDARSHSVIGQRRAQMTRVMAATALSGILTFTFMPGGEAGHSVGASTGETSVEVGSNGGTVAAAEASSRGYSADGIFQPGTQAGAETNPGSVSAAEASSRGFNAEGVNVPGTQAGAEVHTSSVAEAEASSRGFNTEGIFQPGTQAGAETNPGSVSAAEAASRGIDTGAEALKSAETLNLTQMTINQDENPWDNVAKLLTGHQFAGEDVAKITKMIAEANGIESARLGTSGSVSEYNIPPGTVLNIPEQARNLISTILNTKT